MTGSREELLAELRPGAFGVAYRMLGSVSEAEDVVQEGLVRFNDALERGEEISSPRAYLATVVTRLAIDELRSARARRETYVGEWLPEPLLTAPGADPAEQVELADSLSFAFLVLLEQLTPEERAVVLLHDVFDYGYAEVAEVVGKSEDNARQLAVRARRRLGEGRPRFEGGKQRQRELAVRFFEAAGRGDVAGLEALLARDVILRGDGGGKVPALARALRGANRVARTVVNWAKAGLGTEIGLCPAEINGLPGVILTSASGGVIGAMALESDGERVTGVNSVVNPDKLQHLGRVEGLDQVLGRD
ncbi:MAG TPA: RNA polymerase sigma-70 factor [Solirubrobacterales bacterium]|nr:RNA polymerase sigma-70 factor [Solirubrobacterales bacterium]